MTPVGLRPLSSVVCIEHGWAFKGELFVVPSDDLPVLLKPGNFRASGGLNTSYGRSQCYSGDYPKEYELVPGDLLVVMTCQTQGGEILGVPAFIPKDGRTYLHNQRLGKVVRRAEAEVDLNYIYWLLADPRMRDRLAATATGSTVLHTSPTRICELSVWLPPVPEQRRIAGVLATLDDKIEHNRGLRAKLDGAVTRVAAECVAAAADEQPLDEVARFVNGKAFTKHAGGSGRPILRIKELNSGLSGTTPYAEVDADDDNVARHHDLLFSWSGTLDVYRWDGPESLINQHIFKVIPHNGYPLWLVEFWTRQHLERFRVIAKDKAVTMGHIRREDLAAAQVLLPDTDALRRSRELGDPIDAMRGAIAAESRRLAAIRDTLLPKLVSGEIRVPDSYDPDDVLGTVAEAAGVAAP